MSEYGLTKNPEAAMKISDYNPTPRERLTQKKHVLELALTAVNAALKALDEHPDVEQVMTLVQLAL